MSSAYVVERFPAWKPRKTVYSRKADMSPYERLPSTTCWPPTASTASSDALSARETPASISAETPATWTASRSASLTRTSYVAPAAVSPEKRRSVRTLEMARSASADASASRCCTSCCRSLIRRPDHCESSDAAGKAARPTAHSAGDNLNIMPTQPTIMIEPRAAATACVVATFCSACVSADSRESSSPLRVTSKKASSCRSSESNVRRRSEAEMASPAEVSVSERPAIITDCAVNSAKSAPATRAGVQKPSPARQTSIASPTAFGKTSEMTDDALSSAKPPASRQRSGQTRSSTCAAKLLLLPPAGGTAAVAAALTVLVVAADLAALVVLVVAAVAAALVVLVVAADAVALVLVEPVLWRRRMLLGSSGGRLIAWQARRRASINMFATVRFVLF